MQILKKSGIPNGLHLSLHMVLEPLLRYQLIFKSKIPVSLSLYFCDTDENRHTASGK